MIQKISIIALVALINSAYVINITELFNEPSDLYIYGTVTMEDDEVYKGQIRWGKEEAFWFDYFNSSKPENENLDYLSKSQIRELDENDDNRWGGINFGWNNNWSNSHTHQFACQFGDIAKLEFGRGDRVKVYLNNGDMIKVEGGSNDIQTDIQIKDHELGVIKLDWDRINHIEFSSAPSDTESAFGPPLYGTVTAENGESFTGFVQWDHDERMAHDVLNGESKNGEMDIEFGNIVKIEKDFRGSIITTKSGREFELRGSNDVNDENRGIIVNIIGQGRVDITWDKFESVTFDHESAMSGYQKSDFTGDNKLFGTVITESGEEHSGRIIYDLDEEYQLEILQGKNDDIEYLIPFSHIKSITPKRRDRSSIKLINGTEITLEDSVDVSDDNDGVLVFSDNDGDPVYIPWQDIQEINFQ